VNGPCIVIAGIGTGVGPDSLPVRTECQILTPNRRFGPTNSNAPQRDDRMTPSHLMDFLADQLANVEAGWSVGTFGAIAEFTRDPGEPAELNRTSERISAVTGQGRASHRMSPRTTLDRVGIAHD
jgi:hypothetical protein